MFDTGLFPFHVDMMMINKHFPAWLLIFDGTVKPVYNEHLYNKIYPLWFIQ